MRHVEAGATLPRKTRKGLASSLESVGPKGVGAEHAHIIPVFERR